VGQVCITIIVIIIPYIHTNNAYYCDTEAVRDVLQACYTSGTESADGSRKGFTVSPGMPLCEGVVRQLLQRCAESLLRREQKIQAIGRNDGLDAIYIG
jgi:hypothetical protein